MKVPSLMALALWLSLFAAIVVRPASALEESEHFARMKEVHARFTGTPGTLALFGDSISVSLAFWAPLAGQPEGMTPELAAAHKRVSAYLEPKCWSQWRGAEFGNDGGRTIRWAQDHVDSWLKTLNPEAVVILFGTNDLLTLDAKEFEQKTSDVVERCLANGTVVLLTTLPPRSGLVEKSAQFAEVVRRVAKAKRVPLIDYQAEILKRRPEDWDGSLPQFKDAGGNEYDVATLVCRDGVHPSYPKSHQTYSEESLCKNGYLLRSCMTLQAYDQVIEQVFDHKQRGAK